MLLAVLGLSALIFLKLILRDPVLARDDAHILTHLNSPAYVKHLLDTGQYSLAMSVSPFRDLTYFVDLWVGKTLGFGSFHLSNFLIWCGIVVTAWSILKKLYEESRFVLGLVALFALHPIFVDSVGWISARKHLLSCLFSLLATNQVVRFQKSGGSKALSAASVLVFFSLAILSQPIFVLWPLWAVCYVYCIPREERRGGLGLLPAVCLPFLLLAVIASLYYYSYFYPIFTAAQKWTGSEAIGIPFLALGRYLFNLLVPVKLALVYYPGSLWNVIGLLGGSALLVILAFRTEWRRFLPWFAFFLLPLLPVTVKPTNVFVSDTYVLSSAFGLLNLVALGFLSIGPRWRRAAVPVLLGFVLLSFQQAKAWESDRNLWRSSYLTEPAPRSLAFYARYLIEDGNFDEALEKIAALEEWDPGNDDIPYLYSKTVYLNPRIATAQKISMLEHLQGHGPWPDYYLASVHAGAGEFRQAMPLIARALDGGLRLSTDSADVSAEATYICEKAGLPDCSQYYIRGALFPKYWDEDLYQKRIAGLRSPRSRLVEETRLYFVDGMQCGGCGFSVEHSLEKIGIEKQRIVELDYGTASSPGRLRLRLADYRGKETDCQVIHAIESHSGYHAYLDPNDRNPCR